MAIDDEMLEEEAPVDELDPVDAVEPEPTAKLPEPAPVKSGYQAMPNLAATLPVAYLKRVAAGVLSRAESDYKSCEKWRTQTANHYKLYEGDVSDSIMDQKNITVMHMPFVRRSVRMFHSKMFPQLYPPTGELLMLKAGFGLEAQAEKCAADMNNQLYNQMPEYIPSHDRGMVQNLVEGVTYEVFEYDPLEERAKQTICLAEDCWIPYKSTSCRPDMADVPRITWRKRYYQHELEAAEAKGYYICVTAPRADKSDRMEALFPPEQAYDEAGMPTNSVSPNHDTIDDKPIKESGDQSIGHEQQDPEPDGETEILEQDCYLRLPGEPAQRAFTVCIDRRTQVVLRVARREHEDLADRVRFQREMMEFQAIQQSQAAMFEQAMGAWQAQQQEWEAGQQPVPATDELGMPVIDEATGQPHLLPPPMEGVPPPKQPQQPKPPPEPAPVKMVPWHRWTKYDCTMNPRGALGHGVPHDVAGQNQLANKVATRAVSNMTLSFLKTGIASRQSRFSRGDMVLRLGEINESPLSPSQVQAGAGIAWIDIPPPAPDWYKAVDMADKSAQEVTAFDIAMGAPGMSGETATEAEMRHSNATDNISEVAQRYNRARATALRNLAYINSVTIPDEGRTVYKGGTEIRVFREDYEAILSSMEIVFTCDPNLESKAVKAKKAERLFTTVTNMISTGPIPAVDPNTGILLVRAASAMMLKAAEAPPEWITAIEQSPMPNMGAPSGGQPGQPGGENGQGNGSAPGPDGGGASPVPGNAPGPVAEG